MDPDQDNMEQDTEKMEEDVEEFTITQKTPDKFLIQEKHLYLDRQFTPRIVKGAPPPKDEDTFVQPPWRAPTLHQGGIGPFGPAVQALFNHPKGKEKTKQLEQFLEMCENYSPNK